VQQFDGNGKIFLHSSIYMDSKKVNIFATIVPTHCACPALPAAHVGLNGTVISSLNSMIIGQHFGHHPGQFMTNNPRIGIDWLAACKCVKVASTYAYLLHAN
jgi:hypothetical protein